jgi:hypothetical protein
MSSWSPNSTSEIKSEAETILLEEDADDDTIRNYELIRDTTYLEAIAAYQDNDDLNGYFYFTSYLHLANELEKILRIEGTFFCLNK